MALSAPLQAQSCKAYFSKLATNDLTSGLLNSKIHSDVEVWNYSKNKLDLLSGHTARYSVSYLKPDGTVGNRVSNQTLFKLQDFSKSEQKLILSLRKLSISPKNIKPVIDKNKKKLEEKDFSQPEDPFVEMGAYRITLANGEILSGRFTSRQTNGLDNIQRNNETRNPPSLAFNNILVSKTLERESQNSSFDVSEIVEIQFFHTHPNVVALGNGDILFLHDLKNFANEHVGPNVRTSIYAIVEAEGQVYTFQSGL